MELDDLKNQWKQADKEYKKSNLNIMELIHNRSYGPVAELKRSFRKQMIIMGLLPFFMFASNYEHVDKTM